MWGDIPQGWSAEEVGAPVRGLGPPMVGTTPDLDLIL